MFAKTIIFCGILTLSQTQNDCSKYFQYTNYGGETQGLIKMPSDFTKEHKIRVQLTVTRQVSVSSCIGLEFS